MRMRWIFQQSSNWHDHPLVSCSSLLPRHCMTLRPWYLNFWPGRFSVFQVSRVRHTWHKYENTIGWPYLLYDGFDQSPWTRHQVDYTKVTAISNLRFYLRVRRTLHENCKVITRTLATANRSRVSFRGTKILAKEGAMVNPVRIFLSSSVIALQNLVPVSHTVCACRRSQFFFGDTGSPLDGGVAEALDLLLSS